MKKFRMKNMRKKKKMNILKRMKKLSMIMKNNKMETRMKLKNVKRTSMKADYKGEKKISMEQKTRRKMWKM